MTSASQKYLHGFGRGEQDRLYRQAKFLEESIYPQIDFKTQKQILEVGCGVGAQTEILLRRFPKLHVTGIDASAAQLTRARRHLAKMVRSKRVAFKKVDASHLPFKAESFDGAFLCWFLEHVKDPVAVLTEIRRVLEPGAVIYCNEVLNAGFYAHPYSPALLKFWYEFNDHQWNIQSDPFVGGKLGNYLEAAGYQNIQTQVINRHYDNRTPKKRAQYVEYMTSLLLSAAPELIKLKKIQTSTLAQMKKEMEKLKRDPESVIFDSWVQAKAQVL